MIGLNPDFDGEGPPDVSGIYVRTYDANGQLADRDFCRQWTHEQRVISG